VFLIALELATGIPAIVENLEVVPVAITSGGSARGTAEDRGGTTVGL
jgi:hypothetical protein